MAFQHCVINLHGGIAYWRGSAGLGFKKTWCALIKAWPLSGRPSLKPPLS